MPGKQKAVFELSEVQAYFAFGLGLGEHSTERFFASWDRFVFLASRRLWAGRVKVFAGDGEPTAPFVDSSSPQDGERFQAFLAEPAS